MINKFPKFIEGLSGEEEYLVLEILKQDEINQAIQYNLETKQECDKWMKERGYK